MPQKSVLRLSFPVGGLHRGLPASQQPPYTTPHCLNVRPHDVIDKRGRGGSRPGLIKHYYEQLGSGTPVRMLSQLPIVNVQGYLMWADYFTGSSLASLWGTAAWEAHKPRILPDDLASVSYDETAAAVRDALTPWDESQAYMLELYVLPFADAHCGSYDLFFRMNDASPDYATNGARARLTLGATGAYSGTLSVVVGGVTTNYAFTGGTDGVAMPGYFRVLVSGNNVTCYWNGHTLKAQTISAPAGKRFGFGMACTTEGGLCLASEFRIQYVATALKETQQTRVVASAGGKLYSDSYDGVLAEVSATPTIASDRLILARPRCQKLYIADHGEPKARGTDGVAAGADLDAPSVSDWSALGIVKTDDLLIIRDGTGTVVDGVYGISTVAAGKITASSSIGTGNCSYRIERGPKVYDPIAATLTLWTATGGKGNVPVGCPLIELYRDRLLLAGHPTFPHLWYLSRAGDPLDWDYGADDVGRAVAGTLEQAGGIGDAIMAVAAHGDDWCLFGTRSSLWLMRGDPNTGGQLDALSRTVGIISRGAWCYGPEGQVVILSREGLYLVSPGNALTPLSREYLPDELTDINTDIVTPLLRWDAHDFGVHIYLTGATATNTRHWWMDWNSRRFWPVTLQGDHEPTAIGDVPSAKAIGSDVLLGGRDGYVRRFSRTAEHDDGTAFSSLVQYGPLRTGGDDYSDGKVVEQVATLARNSGPVAWQLRGAAAPEDTQDVTAQASGTWSIAGRNRPDYPHMRAPWVALELSAGASRRAWAVESLTTIVERCGKQRVL